MYAHQRTVLDKRRPKKDGLYPVKVRVTFQRKQKYFPTGVSLTQSDFDLITNQTTKKHLRSAMEKILAMESKIRKAIDSIKDFSFEELDSLLLKKQSTSSSTEVYDLFDEIISNLNAEGRISTASAYKDARNSLAGYKAKLQFKQVTVQFLKNYEARMKEEGKTISTLGIYLRHFRAIYNRAIEKGSLNKNIIPLEKQVSDQGAKKYQEGFND
jgi:integrase/recombinase XerD